jgi:hypothetical protein
LLSGRPPCFLRQNLRRRISSVKSLKQRSSELNKLNSDDSRRRKKTNAFEAVALLAAAERPLQQSDLKAPSGGDLVTTRKR